MTSNAEDNEQPFCHELTFLIPDFNHEFLQDRALVLKASHDFFFRFRMRYIWFFRWWLNFKLLILL